MKAALAWLALCATAHAAIVRTPSDTGGRTCSSKPCTYSVNCDGAPCNPAEIQTALDEAQLGDTITLEAGKTWDIERPLILYRKENGSGFLTVRSSAGDDWLPAPNTRITPAYVPLMPTLRLASAVNRLMTVEQTPRAVEYYQFIGVNFTTSDAVDVHDLIRLWAVGIHTDPSYTPNHIVFDRCILRGHPLRSAAKGMRFHVRNGVVKNSFLDEFKAQIDAQAISNFNGPGPILIQNNYLSATGENIMTGGAIPDIPNLVPANYTVEFNAFVKDRDQLSKEEWKPDTYVRKGRITQIGRSYYKALDSGVTGETRPAFPLSTVNRAPRNPLMPGYVRTIDYACDPEYCVTDNGIRWQLIYVEPKRWVPGMQVTKGDIVSYTGPETNNTAMSFYAAQDGITGLIPPFRLPVLPFNPTPDICAPAFCIEDGTTQWQRYTDTSILWVVKNLLEYKVMDTSIIRWNLFSGSWVDGQTGWGISFKPENQDPKNSWVARTENIEFAYNVITNVARPFNFQGRGASGTGVARNWNIHNNLIFALRPGNGSALQSTDDANGLRFVHNTIELPQGAGLFTLSGFKKDSLTFVDNIVQRGGFGIKRSAASEGTESLKQSYDSYTVTNNVIEGINVSSYPAGNFNTRFDDVGFADRQNGNYKLRDGGSPFKGSGTDGSDLGADIDMLPLVRSLRVDVTGTEALFTYELTQPISHIPCVIEVSKDRDLSTTIPDTDPVLFRQPDTDRHDQHTLVDRHRMIRIGKNSPLDPETVYWYRLHCGGDLKTGRFRTAGSAEGATTINIGTRRSESSDVVGSVVEYGYSYSRAGDSIIDGGVTEASLCDNTEGCTIPVPAARGKVLYYRQLDRGADGAIVAKHPVRTTVVE
jgi:hypothetical protein